MLHYWTWPEGHRTFAGVDVLGKGMSKNVQQVQLYLLLCRAKCGASESQKRRTFLGITFFYSVKWKPLSFHQRPFLRHLRKFDVSRERIFEADSRLTSSVTVWLHDTAAWEKAAERSFTHLLENSLEPFKHFSRNDWPKHFNLYASAFYIINI